MKYTEDLLGLLSNELQAQQKLVTETKEKITVRDIDSEFKLKIITYETK